MFPQDVLDGFDQWVGKGLKSDTTIVDWSDRPKQVQAQALTWDEGSDVWEHTGDKSCEKPCDKPCDNSSDKRCGSPCNKPCEDNCWRECCFELVAKSIDWCSDKEFPIATFAVKQRFQNLIGTLECLAQTKQGPMCRKEKVLISSCGLFSINIPRQTTVLCLTLLLPVPKKEKTQLAKLKGLFMSTKH